MNHSLKASHLPTGHVTCVPHHRHYCGFSFLKVGSLDRLLLSGHFLCEDTVSGWLGGAVVAREQVLWGKFMSMKVLSYTSPRFQSNTSIWGVEKT